MKLLIAFLFTIVMIFLNAFTAYQTYNWFVFDFTKIPISISQFCGIMVFLNAILPYSQSSIKSEYEDETKRIVNVIFTPIILLIIGYILKLIL